MLMTLSLALLTVLQVLWLRAEYRAAADSFRRETNLLFRTTVQHLADSVFFSQIKLMPGYDSINGIQFPMFRFPPNAGDSTRHASNPPLKTMEIRHEVNDTSKKGTRQVRVRLSRQLNDNLHNAPATGNHQTLGNPRYFFSMFSEGFNPDSLKIKYLKVLPEQYQNLNLSIVEKEIDWFQHGWSRPAFGRIDSLPFMTGFVPLGVNRVFAANFSGVKNYLFIEIIPQIAFSVIITGLIILSFIVVSKNLRAQQRLIEQKNDFIGNMTHELKTPVSTVGVALEAMKNFDVLKNPEKANEYIDMARHELDRLSMMTDKILKTSVFDYETEIKNNKTATDLREIVKKVIDSFSLLAEKMGLKLMFEHVGVCKLNGNHEHLTQMVYNLVDNAFKYAGHGPEIKISLTEHQDYIVLVVADKGPGIAEEHQEKIFDKFYRVPSGNVHTVKGYGLGLNYVAGVVRSHGGKISLESKPGHGAAFEVKLPKNT